MIASVIITVISGVLGERKADAGLIRNAERATYEYVSLFRRHGIDPAQGALAFVNSRAFVASNIIGATTLAQLQANIDSLNVVLPPEVLDGIEAIHQRYPNPAP